MFDDHRRSNWTPYVYRTDDYGASWIRLADEGDVWGYALLIAQDPVDPDLLFLGTEFGLYVSLDGGTQWNKWTHGVPTVGVRDLVVQPREHDLVIGTHGRAAFVLDDISPYVGFNSWAQTAVIGAQFFGITREEVSRELAEVFDTFGYEASEAADYLEAAE